MKEKFTSGSMEIDFQFDFTNSPKLINQFNNININKSYSEFSNSNKSPSPVVDTCLENKIEINYNHLDSTCYSRRKRLFSELDKIDIINEDFKKNNYSDFSNTCATQSSKFSDDSNFTNINYSYIAKKKMFKSKASSNIYSITINENSNLNPNYMLESTQYYPAINRLSEDLERIENK